MAFVSVSAHPEVDTLVETCGYAAAALTICDPGFRRFLGVMPLHVGMVIEIAHRHDRQLTRGQVGHGADPSDRRHGRDSPAWPPAGHHRGEVVLPGLGGHDRRALHVLRVHASRLGPSPTRSSATEGSYRSSR